MGLLVVVLFKVALLGWIPREQFHLNKKKSSSITVPFDLTCRGLFCRGGTGVFQVADCRISCGSYTKHHVSSPVMIRLRNFESSSTLLIRSAQIIMRLSRWSYVRMRGTLCWVTRDMFKSEYYSTYHGWPLLLPRRRLPIWSGWHAPTRQPLQSRVQFEQFVPDQYAHHLPNCL